MNFLKETINKIESNGQTVENIIFIGSRESGHSCTWGQFVELANFDYNNGFGGQEIPSDLMIAFADGAMMTRGEYDGSEWWDYIEPFKMPKEQKPIKTLQSHQYWVNIADIQKEAEECK